MSKILPSVQDLQFSKSHRIYNADSLEPRTLFPISAFCYSIANKFAQWLFNAKSITQSNIDNALTAAINNIASIKSTPENID